MKRLRAILLLILLGTATPAAAQIPPEWQAAAQAVIGELERDTPQAAKPWTGAELTQGWNLARAWRRHNNGNIEIILAEYLTFVALCRIGCAGSTIEGQGYISVAEQVKALIAQNGGSYALASNAHAWLGGLSDPTGGPEERGPLEQGPRRPVGRLRDRQPLCAHLAAGAQETDARGTGRHLRPLRDLRADQGLDRPALPRHLEGRHGARRGAAHRGV